MDGCKNRGGKSHREEKRRRKKISEKWREGHFEVSCEKLSGSEHFWKLRCSKSARRCRADFEVKMRKRPGWAHLRVEMFKK